MDRHLDGERLEEPPKWAQEIGPGRVMLDPYEDAQDFSADLRISSRVRGLRTMPICSSRLRIIALRRMTWRGPIGCEP